MYSVITGAISVLHPSLCGLFSSLLTTSFMLLDRINKEEVDVEKGLAKARYEIMDCGDEVDEEGSKGVPDKSLNYATLRATDIPTVARLCPPRPSTLEKEKILDNIKGV